MANERITEDIVRTHFKEDALFKSVKWEEQKSSIRRVQELLKGESKGNGKGNGYPEFILSFPTNSSYLIVVECKAKLSDHESLSKDRPVKYAVDGVLHYAKALSASYNVIAIAASGQNETELKVSHFYWKKEANSYSELGDNKLLAIDDYMQVFDDQFFISDFYTRDIAYKAQFLNEEFNNYTIPEYKRCTMISAMLLALISHKFQAEYEKEETTKELGQSLLSAINAVFESEEDMVRNKGVLMREFESILNEPIFTQHTIKNKKAKKDEFTLSVLKEFINYLHNYVYPLISHSNIGYDVLGRFYIEFIRYAASEQKSGLVLTPSHITELFCDLGELTANDVVYDPCCGTGGFLVAAMQRMFKLAGNNKRIREKIRKKQLCGCEIRPDIFSYACSSMRFRGDGKSNIYNGSCFNNARSIADNHKPSVSFLNPPYDVGTAGQLEFVEHSLSVLNPNAYGRIVAIVQMSCATKNEKDLLEVKKRLLSKHHLRAVISMPDDLFYPVGVVTCIMVFEANKPNVGKKTWFGYFKDDGFEKRKYVGRIDAKNRYASLKSRLLHAYLNYEEVPGLYVRKEINHKDEWCAEAYIETDYSTITPSNFDEIIRHYCAYKIISQIPISGCDLNSMLPKMDLRPTNNWSRFKIKDLFDIVKGKRLTKADMIEGNIPFIGATDNSNGITAHIGNDENIHSGNLITVSYNGSIGYAFYQPVPFVASDDINILYPKFKLNQYNAMFLCAIIYNERYRYNYGRKWDKTSMLNSFIFLPSESKNPDWEYMENFIKSRPYSKLLETPLEKSYVIKENPFESADGYSNSYVEDPSLAAEPFEIYGWNELYSQAKYASNYNDTVLIGCFRDKKHLEWILNNHVYNIRLGKRKGSAMNNNEYFENARQLYLYDVKDPSKMTVFKISSNQEMLGSELRDMGYPNKTPGKSYMTFKIEDLEETEKDNNTLNVSDILSRLDNHVKGTPVFIGPSNQQDY